jgi:hypothetical protein
MIRPRFGFLGAEGVRHVRLFVMAAPHDTEQHRAGA